MFADGWGAAVAFIICKLFVVYSCISVSWIIMGNVYNERVDF